MTLKFFRSEEVFPLAEGDEACVLMLIKKGYGSKNEIQKRRFGVKVTKETEQNLEGILPNIDESQT